VNRFADSPRNPLLELKVVRSEMPRMKFFSVLLAGLLAFGVSSVVAHPGHHHETGLPAFSAHILLGLQYLAALLIPAAAVTLYIRSARRKKSRNANTRTQE